MLDLARQQAPGAEDVRRLTLPDDPLPRADAVVSVGHVLSYLPDEGAIDGALVAMAGALAPSGLLAIDLCDLRWADAWRDRAGVVRRTDDWVLATEYSIPSRNRFVREMTTFVRGADGSWRRDDERHVNVLVDTSLVPALLGDRGVDAEVRAAFGDERLPDGLVAVVGRAVGR
jgi:hypothetical protein